MVQSHIVEISKYPNRRLYDRAHSRHLTQEELYAMVISGTTVRVTDSASGQDITSQTLLQLLIEHDPSKLAAVPSEVMHLLLRSNDAMLRGFFANAMQQFFQNVFAAMRPAGGAGGGPSGGTVGGIPFGIPGMMNWPWAPPQAPTPGPADSAGKSDGVNERIDQLSAELEELRRRSSASQR